MLWGSTVWFISLHCILITVLVLWVNRSASFSTASTQRSGDERLTTGHKRHFTFRAEGTAMSTSKMLEVSSVPSMDYKDCESLASATSFSTVGKSVRFKALKSEVELLKEQVKLLLENSKLNFNTVKQEMDTVKEDDIMANKASTLDFNTVKQEMDTVKEDDIMAKHDFHHAEDVVDVDQVKTMAVAKSSTTKQGVAKGYLEHLNQTVEKKNKMQALEDAAKEQPAPSAVESAQALSDETAHPPSGNDEDDIIEEIKSSPPKEEEKSVVLSGIHNQSEPGTWKVVAHPDAASETREEHSNVEMTLICGSGSGGGGEQVKKSEKKNGIRKLLSRLFRGGKSVKKVDSKNINKPSAGMEMTPTGGGAAANPAESVTTDGGDMSDTKQPLDDEEGGSKDASNANIQVEKEDGSQQRSKAELVDVTLTTEPSEEHKDDDMKDDHTNMTSKDYVDVVAVDKSSPEVEEAVAEEKSTKARDDDSVALRVTKKEAECVSKEKAENSASDSENQADSAESSLAEVSTKPELGASAAPENNKEQDEGCDKSVTSRRSTVTFRSSNALATAETAEDEESVRSTPRHGTVSHLKEKFNRLARSPSINRVSSGFSSRSGLSNRKPTIQAPVKVHDNAPLETAQRDDTETTTTEEQNTPTDLSEADTMKRTRSFKSYMTAPPYFRAKLSEEKTPRPISLQQEEIQVETVASRCLNDDEDDCEIEIEAMSAVPLWRSPLPDTEPKVSLPVKRVVSY